MADLENGYTRIANEILEEMAKIKLSPTQYRILFVVWRYTYGFQRKKHQLSLTFLAEATQCDLRLIQRELKKLIKARILKAEQTKGLARQISFNKKTKEWQVDIGEIDNGKTDNGDIDNIAIGEIDNIAIGEIDNQERKKEIYKERGAITEKNNYKSVFDYYLSLGLIKHTTYTDAMAKAIKRAIDDNNYSIEDCKTLLDRHKKVTELTKNDGKFTVRVRPIHVFFGQKVKDATHLICTEYDIGGKYYEKYIKPEETKQNRTPFKPTIVYVNEG